VGYNEWQRGNSEVAGALPENYSWFYAPVGLRYELQASDKFEWDLDASVDFMFGGKINFQYSEISNYQDATAPLAGRIGYRIQSPLLWRLTPTLKFLASPWLQYSAIGGSPWVPISDSSGVQGIAREPASRTYEIGSTLGVIVDL
jgi:hypothetical protein